MIALNLVFLFSVSLFPFALSFTISSSNIIQYSWGLYAYIGIIYLMFFTQTVLIHYMVRNATVLCLRPDEVSAEFCWKVRRLSYIGMPAMILLLVGGGYFGISQYIIYGAMALYGLTVKTLKRKWYPNAQADNLSVGSFFRKAKVTQLPVKSISHKR